MRLLVRLQPIVMPIVQVGSICIKNKGREKGSKCVIVDIVDNKYVLVTGPKKITGVKRRRANILHLDLTDKSIEVSKGASDEEVEKKLLESGLLEFMKEKAKL